ncbi:hypothetical protein [Microlunatus sp. GCM10028923]|uniref:hypothetical protein n=1 Tax=Microlunatus sp. GCM10028923 TaxID=3273400 RepID=UPI00361962DC
MMMMPIKTIGGALSGLLMGVTLLFLGCLAAVAVAWSTGRGQIPFIIDAHSAPGGGAAGVEFIPNGIGMLVVLVVCAGVGAAVVVADRVRPKRDRSRHDDALSPGA